MKQLFLLAMFLGLPCLAHAEEICNTETRFSGAAAIELYASLSIPEVSVSDEHGGPAYALAKYGKLFGCQKNLDGSNTECWYIQSFPKRYCD